MEGGGEAAEGPGLPRQAPAELVRLDKLGEPERGEVPPLLRAAGEIRDHDVHRILIEDLQCLGAFASASDL